MEIEKQLIRLSGQHERIPPLEQHFDTLLGFARKEGDEVTWNRILRYFLRPDAAHGLDDSVLRHLLQALATQDPTRQHGPLFDRTPSWRVTDLQVDDQVQLDGRPIDLVIRDPGRWFICIELKVWASEGANQTVDYANSEKIGDEEVSSYPEDGQHYVYITREKDNSESEKFVDYSWKHIARHLRRTLADDSTHSARGLAQMRDFTDAISNQFDFHMTSDNTQHPIEDRIALYNEYRGDLITLEKAFGEFAEREGKRWSERFTTKYPSNKWNKDWFAFQRKPEQGQLYHRSWTFHPDGPSDLSYSPLVHLEFDIKPDQLRYGRMQFRFSVSGGPENPKEKTDWRVTIQNWLQKNTQFQQALPKKATWGERKNHLTELTYTGIDFDRETFYETIRDGFEDHYDAAMVLTEIVEEKVDPEIDEIVND